MIHTNSKLVDERGVKCFYKVANIWNATKNPWFKVDQRSITDRFKKLLETFVADRIAEDKV